MAWNRLRLFFQWKSSDFIWHNLLVCFSYHGTCSIHKGWKFCKFIFKEVETISNMLLSKCPYCEFIFNHWKQFSWFSFHQFKFQWTSYDLFIHENVYLWQYINNSINWTSTTTFQSQNTLKKVHVHNFYFYANNLLIGFYHHHEPWHGTDY